MLQSLLVVVTVVFILSRTSGDPATLLLPASGTKDDLVRIRRSLGIDRPLVEQYGRFLGSLIRGDLGKSFSNQRPVTSILANALPASLRLGFLAFLVALFVGVTVGYLSAMRSGGWFDHIGRIVTVTGQSVPAFCLGIFLVVIFAVHLRWFPAYGSTGWKSYVLPCVALASYPLAAITRITRSSVLDLVGSEMVRFQRSKGLAPHVLVRHILRNASLPVITLAGIQLGWLLSGAIIIEGVFAWPGIGTVALQAISSRDYNVIQGTVIVTTGIYLFILLLVDLSYTVLDPRTRGAPVSASRIGVEA